MVSKNKSNQRTPLFASLEFRRRLQKIQGELLTNGKRRSLTDITDIMIKTPSFDNVEKEILNEIQRTQNSFDVRIKFDTKRLLQ